jgi:PAS domain S-box-containing protein
MATEHDPAGPLQQLLDGLEEATSLLALDGTVLVANETCASRLGLSRSDLIGRNLCDLLSPDEATERRLMFAEVARTGQATAWTTARDGRWLERRIVPVLDAGGCVERLAVYSVDVTARRDAERERASRGAELETIHEHLPVPVLMVDEDFRVTGANRAAANLRGSNGLATGGAAGGPLVGGGIGCLNSLHDRRGCGHGPDCGLCELRRAIREAVTSDKAIDRLPVTLPMASPEGAEATHLLVSSAPVRVAGRRRALVTLLDITDLRRAEDDVAFKAMALDQIQDRVTATDLEGRVVYVNNAACRSLRARREDLVGRSVTEFGDDPNAGATQREIIDTTLARGRWDGEVVNLAHDGARSLLHCRTVLMRDRNDVPIGMCGIATDITEAKARERELQQSEHRFRSLYEQLPIGYFALDGEGRYLEANPAWLRLAGGAVSDPAARPFAEALDAEQAARFATARRDVQDGREVELEIQVRGAGGNAATVLCIGRGGTGAPDAPAVTRWVAVDVSERRRLEAQLRQAQKLDALGRLAAGVAHDFNNQLTVISGYCEILLESATAEVARRSALEQIRLATQRAVSTTGHLLAFSRRRELAPRLVDLNASLRDLLPPLRKLIGETIAVRTELSPGPGHVRVDPGALEQAVFNLVINARDAMPEGGRLVLRTAVHAAAQDGSPGAIELEVEDDGHGIEPADLERVFEPFFTTKPEGKGSGLGLAMTRGFVEQSGGTIAIRSRPGSGTVVTLTLPIARESVYPVDGPALAPADGSLCGRILVVEDAEEVRALVNEALRQQGATVTVAASPADALALAVAGEPFDVLVTDLVLPGIRGDELARRLLAHGRVRRVIYMSGYRDAHARDAGAILLTKPFTVQELVEAARQALSAAERADAVVGEVPA